MQSGNSRTSGRNQAGYVGCVTSKIACLTLLWGIACTASAADPSLLSIARANGFSVCGKEISSLERNLFGASDFSVRFFTAEKTPSARPFTAIVDARRATPVGGFNRTLTHLAVTPAGKNESCSVSYEQTQYHERNCNDVQAQMAPKASPAGGVSLGAVTLDLHRNMTLTLIPVGAAQCVTVLKEVSY